MSRYNEFIPEPINRYLIEHSLHEPAILRELRELTAELAQAQMQISPLQGQFMAMLIKLTGAKRCIEVGTFTGYSSLAVALALPDDGHIIACDVSAQWTAIAQRFWAQAGVADKVTLELRPAAETLQAMLDAGQSGSHDFVFIDADKAAYQTYYELALKLLRPGGLIVIDNTLWSGKVADAAIDDANTSALRAFNQHLHADQRIDLSVLPISDGLSLARKRVDVAMPT
ncbi:MAG: class I SAM-dependent methyltransferase [Xanthomonadales bacterium]|nr:class I SAM-dependent methyltransferase [Xanthomonadales bacterium]